MPRMDGTGPMGEGPKTGRGMGSCEGEATPRYGIGRGRGRGFGSRCGRGLGRGRGLNRVSAKLNKETLEDQRDALKDKLSIIDAKLKDL
ncbi:MAG: DUF5320 domain-containing protein [Clostridiales bacterium]|nr:DUF5320 domain-containing protein [Clostridiales bacterium]